MRNITLFFTGGTIGSRVGANGERQLAGTAAVSQLLETFQNKHPECDCTFFEQTILHCLSENITPEHWTTLCQAFQAVDVTNCSGVVCTHGTDTLAETAAFLSVLLQGFPIPVVLVSANAPLWDIQTNGHDNFAAAISLLQEGLTAGVWVVYRNSDGQLYVHRGSQLCPCPNGSNDFFSPEMYPMYTFSEKRVPVLQSAPWLSRVKTVAGDVLLLRPYPGMRYDTISVSNVHAVVHGTYHSETANALPNSVYGVQTLLKSCAAHDIPCYLAPCKQAGERYASTAELLRTGAIPLPMPLPLAYGAATVGCALGYRGATLTAWLNDYSASAVNHSFR